ncbi:hypothetical protein DA2_1306 [Desulfovibrio sp. A2]|nr:hypothetical protein DA2_1306 [Desulfovibrio sp. A2]
MQCLPPPLCPPRKCIRPPRKALAARHISSFTFLNHIKG